MALDLETINQVTGTSPKSTSASDISFLTPMGSTPAGVVGGDPAGFSNQVFAALKTGGKATGRGLKKVGGKLRKVTTGSNIFWTALNLGILFFSDTLGSLLTDRTGIPEKKLELEKEARNVEALLIQEGHAGQNKAVEELSAYYRTKIDQDRNLEQLNFQRRQQSSREGLMLKSLLDSSSDQVANLPSPGQALQAAGRGAVVSGSQPLNYPDFIPQSLPTVGAGINPLLPVSLGGI